MSTCDSVSSATQETLSLQISMAMVKKQQDAMKLQGEALVSLIQPLADGQSGPNVEGMGDSLDISG